MEQEELREKIARWLRCYKLEEIEGIGVDDIISWQFTKDYWLEDATQILALIKEALPELAKEAGYVKLAEDQTIDIPDGVFFSKEAKACGFTKRSFIEAGWRKVDASKLP